MKTYITRINGWDLQDTSYYLQYMVAEIGHQLGCREMGLYRYYVENESRESLNSRMDGIIAGINRGDLIICQFPTGNGTRFEGELISHLKAYGGRVAIFIHELEFFVYEEKRSIQKEIINLYNQAEVLIVSTYAMRQWLLDNGIKKNMKFIVQEMWDYPVNGFITTAPAFKKEIYFTDDNGFAGMNDWNYTVPLKLYNMSTNQGRNVQNMGRRNSHQLFSELSAGGFGLVWYKDEYSRRYMKHNIVFSLARYLSAGIPVIVPPEISNREMIERNHLGIIAASLDEAVRMVEKLTEQEYKEYVKAVEQFAPALWNGYYTKKCLIEAMQAFYRKDAGRISISERVYEEKSVVRSVSLNKSYGGNLALSWDFKGESDGILIYDISGVLIENIHNYYQHYFLIKEKEKGFIIKPYVETLKGKLILTESEPVYLRERSHGKAKVSMIIPAYNAENNISRCIDTVLAQTLEDVEIIVVDDGSTDRTPEIIDWYAEMYENLIVIHQKNGGVSTARNMGIRHANGEYIGFVDSDDMIWPDMVERLYQSAKKNNCDIAITSAYTVTDMDYIKYLRYAIKEDVAIATDDFYHTYTYGNDLGLVVWNKLYRTSLVKKHIFPIMSYEDVAWTTYILSYANTICYLNDFSYDWDRSGEGDSLSERLNKYSNQEIFEQIKRAVLFYMDNGNPEKIKFLKETAKIYLSGRVNVYDYREYEKLSEEIEKKY